MAEIDWLIGWYRLINWLTDVFGIDRLIVFQWLVEIDWLANWLRLIDWLFDIDWLGLIDIVVCHCVSDACISRHFNPVARDCLHPAPASIGWWSRWSETLPVHTTGSRCGVCLLHYVLTQAISSLALFDFLLLKSYVQTLLPIGGLVGHGLVCILLVLSPEVLPMLDPPAGFAFHWFWSGVQLMSFFLNQSFVNVGLQLQ